MSPKSKLFSPIRVGDLSLKHRVVLAPLTRYRGTDTHVPGPKAAEYYSQRGSAPGTLLITEATLIAAKAGGYSNVPGIWSEEQIRGWKQVTDAVHAKGSFIYLQLWALGRAANPDVLEKEDPSFPYVSSWTTQLTGKPTPPRALTVPEIHEYVQLYATAASNAVHRAGFDGVEVHGANGYLIDQFLQDTTNQRDDAYGGSVENRTRFALEVVDAVVKEVGETKTGIRLSPWSDFQGRIERLSPFFILMVYATDMGMSDPIPTYSHLVARLRDSHPNLSYIHVIEPTISGYNEVTQEESNDFIREIWAPRRIISAGGYNRSTSINAAEEKGDLIAFGRMFISNPDLPRRLKENIPLSISNRQTYYLHGNHTSLGYTDYPFANEQSWKVEEVSQARL